MARILIAEDEEPMANLYSIWLKAAGHEIHRAPNGEDALKAAMFELQPDLLITDLMMPVSDGEELSLSLSVVLPDLRIIIVTGYPQSRQVQRLLDDEHIEGVLPKPLKRQELLDAVDRALARD